MTTAGKKHTIQTPLLGVRADIDSIAKTGDMMETGVNVVTVGASARPRCAHTREGFGGIATDWIKLLATTPTARQISVAAGDGWLIAITGRSNWKVSTNDGVTWGSLATSGLPAGVDIQRIFAFTDGATSNLWAWTYDSLYRADMAGYAGGSLTFTSLYDATNPPLRIIDGDKRIVASPQEHDPVHYDDSIEHAVMWQTKGDGNEPISLVRNAYTVVDHATFADGYSNSFGYQYSYVGGELYYDPPFRSGEWKLVGVGLPLPSLGQLTMGILANRNDSREVRFVNMTPTSADYYRFAPSYQKTFQRDVLAGRLYPEGAPGSPKKAELLMADRLIEYDLDTEVQVALSSVYSLNSFETYAINRLDPNTAIMLGDINLRTEDGYTSWTEYEGMLDTQASVRRVYASTTGANEMFFLETDRGLWWIPGNPIGGVTVKDDVTGIYQCSLDTEEYAFFTGTTTRMRHLDRLAEEWEDITNTTAGAQPAGVLGTNPWVFRPFEKGGDKYMVACNGQVQPQCYKDSYSKMRMLGDPNFDDVIENATPPIAHAMAVANNRLVLASRPHSLWFSRPSDFDLGYDEFEANLNDTQGEIICMNEIGASQIVVFKTDAIYHGTSQVAFMGTSAPMNFKRVRQGIIGPCSPQSVSYLPDGRLTYLGRDGGAYLYDAVSPKDVGRHIRALIRNDIDPDRYGTAWSMVDTTRGLVYYFYPTADGGLNRGVVCSYDMGDPWPAWQFVLPPAWNVVAGMNAYFKRGQMLGSFLPQRLPLYTFPERTLGSFTDGGHFQMVMCRKDGTWYRQEWDLPVNGEYNDAGLLIGCDWESGWHNFDGDNSTYQGLHELHHVAELNGQTINCEVMAEQFNGSVKSQTKSFSEADKRLITKYRLSGRRFKVHFTVFADAIFNYAQATAVEIRRGDR